MDESEVTFVTLNLPEDFSRFISKLKLSGTEILSFHSPAEMLPTLKTVGESFVIVIDADLIQKKGQNEVKKFLEIIQLDPFITIYPIIALTTKDIKYQQKILKMGFASQVISIDSDVQTAKALIFNTVQIFTARHDLELKIQQSSDSLRRSELQRIGEIDKLTGLLNREAFCAKTEEFIKKNPDKNFVIVRWDIDRFKVFNDTYGVEVGDKYLEYIGAEYNSRKWDSITYGHWVADHFVMCIDEDLFSSVEIYNYFSKVVHKFMPEYEFVVRMGVYKIKDPNVSVRLMCDRALLAMDSLNGSFEKRIAYYDDSMLGHLLEEQDMIASLDASLKNQEFSVFFQPQYNFATGKMNGAEALVRWIHPVKGTIKPDKFIPLFEQNGLITRLDEYVWESVCKKLKKWIEDGVNVVPISVNISRRDIYNPKLCSIITGLVKKYEIPPEMLRLEITESAYMDDPDQLIKVVEELKKAGFTLEMDDFGSGYSSLNTLKDVPVDILKLDLKFLISKGDNTRGGSILTSVIRMANWLQMPVIAEGIETKRQANFLKSIGCLNMQGYFFSQPVPEDEFIELMNAGDLEIVPEEEPADSLENAVDFLNISTQNALIFNSFVGGAAIVERYGKSVETLRINDKFFEMIGVTRDEYSVRGSDTLKGFAPSSAKKFVKMLDDAQKTGKEASCVTYSLPLNDKHAGYWIKNRARFLASSNGRDLFYVSTDDISQSMTLQEKNQELADDLLLLIDSVPCGIIKYDVCEKDIKLKYVNQCAANIFGRTTEEFVEMFGVRDDSLIYEKDLKKFKDAIRKSLGERADSFGLWLRVVKKNGTLSRIYMETKITYGKKNKKNLISYTVILIDISQQYEGGISKYRQFIEPLFDEVIEIDYAKDRMTLVHANSRRIRNVFNSEDKSTNAILIPWIKNTVVEKYRKQVAKLLDEEYIKSIQADGEVPFFEFEVLEKDKKSWQRTFLFQINDSKYMICTKKYDKKPHY